MSSVEKEIPEKPTVHKYAVFCNGCHEPLGVNFMEFAIMYKHMNNYCPHCGQKIDWSEYRK